MKQNTSTIAKDSWTTRTYRGEDRCGIIKRAGELPLLASLVRFRLQHHCFHDLEVVLTYIIFSYDHFLNGCEQNKRGDALYNYPIPIERAT